jgi:hypothetical protein
MSQHTVYRFYGADDALLYIGVTADWETRYAAHRTGTAWYPEVARHDLDTFKTDAEAREYETLLIARLAPRYNQRPGGGGRRTTEPDQHRGRSIFTLSPVVLRLLDQETARTGQSKSAIVERALRQILPPETS